MWNNTKPRPRANGASITWNDNTIDVKKGTARVHVPRRYVAPMNVKAVVIESLIVGTAYVITKDMYAMPQGVYPLAVLEVYNYRSSTVHIPKGSLVVYTGTIRTVERKKLNGRKFDVSVVKHTFITPAGRCIIHNLKLIRPVQDAPTTA